jgi:acyl carrier protein
MQKEKLTSPFDLVSKALACEKDSLTENSAMANHPKWESLTHVSVIMGIEDAYEIEIPDEDVMKYDNMKTIIELYKKLASDQ